MKNYKKLGGYIQPVDIRNSDLKVSHLLGLSIEKCFIESIANTIGTANTLKLAKEKNAEGYMFISSREIYGEPMEGQELFTEDGPLGQVNPLVPRNGYAEGKKAAEKHRKGDKQAAPKGGECG